MSVSTNKMQFSIFFDCHTFDIGWQGTTTYLAGIINSLHKAVEIKAPNLDLNIICAANDKAAVDRYLDVNYKFEKIRTNFIPRNTIDIPYAVYKTNPDLVVSQYVRPFFSSRPTLSIIHDVLFLDYPDNFSWLYRFSRKFLFGWSARKSNHISTVSTYSAERIAYHLGVNKNKIIVIPNAVNPAFINNKRIRNTNDTTFQLLSVSRLERRKRHEWGIDALDALSNKGIRAAYTIIGSGDDAYAQELNAAVREARKRGLNVEIKSGLALSELVQEYSDADLFICPSVAEGFGIPLIEAAAAGIPCVSTSGGALAELGEEFAGCMVSPEDHTGFINAVCEIESNKDFNRNIAVEKKKLVVENYNWGRAAEAYIDVILDVMRKD